MVTLNKVSHSYNINFLNMVKLTLYIFSVLVWKRYEENFWTKVLETLKFCVFAYYLKVYVYFL